jgi:hypothetical protein
MDKTIKERVKPPHLYDCRFNSKPKRKMPGYTGSMFIEALTMMHGKQHGHRNFSGSTDEIVTH